MAHSTKFHSRVLLCRILIVMCKFLCGHGIGENQCSLNLVSGPNGVPDDHLSASSTWKNSDSFSPKQGRLHSVKAWKAKTLLNQYIQVDFDTVKQILAVQTQGRHDWAERTTSYAVSYSLDKAKWTFISDENSIEKIFPGNNDRDTVVTNELPEVIIAKHFRIHPRTGVGNYAALRFELIGCTVLINSWKVHPISMTDHQSSLWNTSLSDLGKCAMFCYHQTQCQSFVYNSNTDTCTGFEQEYLHGYRLDVLRGDLYFLRTSTLDKHAIKLKERSYNNTGMVVFKIYTDLVNLTSAKSVCQSDNTGLLAIWNLEIFNILQKEITNNPAIDPRPYVSGSLMDGKWVYNSEVEIPATLWAEGEPKTDSGNCVVVGSKGLVTKECDRERTFICGF